jgi:plastocyanin
MTSNRIVCLVTLAATFLLTGCGQQERAATAGTAYPSDEHAAPIDQATVGEITGKVVLEGNPPQLPRIFMDKDPLCASRHSEPLYAEDGKVNTDGTLPNVFVYVKAGAEKYAFAIPRNPAILDQKGCLFQPHVLGLMVGQELRILSSDPTAHNVHAMSKENREWNQSQTPGGAPLSKRFTRPEIMIPVNCKQHPWMKAYIGVTRNPFHAVTANAGTFTLKGIPAGDYTIEAWTATFGTQQQKVKVKPKESATANFTFRAR